MLLQLAGFIFDCTCIILPTPIVHIDNYCYLYDSILFIPFTALYFILNLSYTLKRGHFENKPHSFIHSFIHTFIHSYMHSFIHSYTHSFIHSVLRDVDGLMTNIEVIKTVLYSKCNKSYNAIC